MKHFFLFINLLLVFNLANSQELNGYVEYSLNIGDDEKLSKGELSEYFKQAKENTIYISFILEFNKKEMDFYSKTAEVDGVNMSFTKAFSGVNGVYYKKINESIVLNSMEDYVLGKIILEKDVKVDWKLHNETKKIQEFICYKATATIKYNNGVGDFQKELIVWYCPRIPYSFGPKGYGGLPGIILEFQENNITIGAKKIVFNKETKITEPEGKTITEKDYEKLQQKKLESEKK
jgi:GLPGLI family protein